MSSKYSKFDTIYRSLLLSNFFTKGWGKPEDLKSIFEFRRRLAKRSEALTYVNKSHQITITKDENKSDHRRIEGHFRTPLADYLPQLLPPETETAYFQAILPLDQANHGRLKPVCIHYAGTGDHYFWRRRGLMALPLLKERGVSSIILENPFYGLRKPKDQFRSSLQQVSDLFVMGAALILESLVIMNFVDREGFCPIVAHGISMGGHMASLGATVWDKPIGLVPCLSWTSASLTFTKGVLTGAINWDLLEKQYSKHNAYKEEVLKMIEFEESAHQAGIDFAQAMDRLAQIRELKQHSNSDRWNQVKSTESVIDSNKINVNIKRETTAEPDIFASQLGEEDLKQLNVPKNLAGSFSMANQISPSNGVKEKQSGIFLQMIPKIIRNDAKGTGDSLHREAVYFMRGIMDECTHLRNYDVPMDPSLIYIVVAENDAYQPREGIAALPDIWPGANIQFIEGKGHVSSYLTKQNVFRNAIYNCIDTYVEKYMQHS